MAESIRLVEEVHRRIDRFLTDRGSILAAIDPDLTPFAAFSRRFLSSGKRFRAQFCFLGWRGCGGAPGAGAIVSAAAALELFHAAALVHDDLIDNSDVRRGDPAAHRHFQDRHRQEGWTGASDRFGSAAAILTGDLLLCFSDELFQEALADAPRTDAARSAREAFARMRMEVMAGQYLDVLDEYAWAVRAESEHVERAMRVLLYKSARYSVADPLAIGGALAGADEPRRNALRDIGVPLGVAFQLRDDLLGVYGNSEVTGKPSGDDLREGKRTVLVALARRRLPAGSRRLLDELLGDPSLDADQIRMLQRTISDSGAVEEVESMIDEHVERADAALDAAHLDPEIVGELRALMRRAARRAA